MKPLLLSTLLLGLCAVALPCTMIRTKLLGGFDTTESIFIGNVIGYTQAPMADEHGNLTGSTANGVIVRVTDEVFLPSRATEIEVFNYLLMADCSIQGLTRSGVESEFPVGTEVRVIGESLQLTKGTSPRPRVEIRPPGPGYIVRNRDATTPRLTTATSVFDYQQYKYDRNRSYEYNSLPNFEIRKDLLRFARSQSQAEREAIAKRLSFAPNDVDFDVESGLSLSTSAPATVIVQKKN